MARREEDLAPRLKIVHAERIGRAAEHLVSVVARAAETGFADAAFAHESLSEARRAYVLWQGASLNGTGTWGSTATVLVADA